MSLSSLDREIKETIARVSVAVLIYAAIPGFSDIARLWTRQAGLEPTWPPGPLEYPPLGLLYLKPLISMPSMGMAVLVNVVVMAFAAVAITWVLLRISQRQQNSTVDIRIWVASPAMILFLGVNWDVLVALMTLLAVGYLYDQRDGRSGMLLGLGTAFKIFPGAVVLPVLPLINGWVKRGIYLVAGFIGLAGSYLLVMVLDPDGWRFHLDFASTRSDISSSIWGLVRWGSELVGNQLSMAAINTMSTGVLAVGLVGVTLWVIRTRPSFAEAATMALLVMMMFNKVFKPQYVFWVLPFLAWLGANRTKTRMLEATAFLQFAAGYLYLEPFLVYVRIETVARIVLLTLLMLDISRSAKQRTGFGPRATEARSG